MSDERFTYVFPDEFAYEDDSGNTISYYVGPDGNALDNPQVLLYGENGEILDTLSLLQKQNQIPESESFLNSLKDHLEK